MYMLIFQYLLKQHRLHDGGNILSMESTCIYSPVKLETHLKIPNNVSFYLIWLRVHCLLDTCTCIVNYIY